MAKGSTCIKELAVFLQKYANDTWGLDGHFAHFFSWKFDWKKKGKKAEIVGHSTCEGVVVVGGVWNKKEVDERAAGSWTVSTGRLLLWLLLMANQKEGGTRWTQVRGLFRSAWPRAHLADKTSENVRIDERGSRACR